jgi:hypothetical protein
MEHIAVAKREGVNWMQIGLFLFLTFGLSWVDGIEVTGLAVAVFASGE